MSATKTRATWSAIPQQLHERGLRWTPQRRLLIEVLSRTRGHVTAGELIERCRAADPDTTPSTVYRTLDVLEALGVVTHGHAANGREEYHVLPASEHGHLSCRGCGGTWEISPSQADPLVASAEHEHGFAVDLSHLTVVGLCAECRKKVTDN